MPALPRSLYSTTTATAAADSAAANSGAGSADAGAQRARGGARGGRSGRGLEAYVLPDRERDREQQHMGHHTGRERSGSASAGGWSDRQHGYGWGAAAAAMLGASSSSSGSNNSNSNPSSAAAAAAAALAAASLGGAREAEAQRRRRLLTTAKLTHCILDWVVDSFLPVIRHSCAEADILDDLSRTLTLASHDELLKRIALARRRIAWIRQWLWSKNDILGALLGKDWKEFVSGIEAPYIRDVLDHNTHMTQEVDMASELLTTVQEGYVTRLNIEVSRASQDTNTVMQSLTGVATIFMPLSLIPGLMGMNCPVPFQEGIDAYGWEYLREMTPFIGIIFVMTVLSTLGWMFFTRQNVIGRMSAVSTDLESILASKQSAKPLPGHGGPSNM